MYRTDNFFGVKLAPQHIGIGHSRHGQVGIGFPPPVAGGLHAHQPGIQFVLHVVFEDAPFYQGGGFRGRTLIVDGQRPAPVLDGSVIDHGDALGGDPLAYAVAERRCPLAVEVAFQAMPYGLVQQDSRPARSQHHRHGARRRRHSLQVVERLSHGILDVAGNDFFIHEIFITEAPAATGAAFFQPAVMLDDDVNIKPDQGPDISAIYAVAAGNQHRGIGGAQAGDDLFYPGVPVTGFGIDPLQQGDLVA